MKKAQRSPFVFGASSLLVIFAVLALVIFSLLALNTALANNRLSVVFADAAYDNAKAQEMAHTILADIRAGNIPEGVKQEGNVYSYSCRIDDTKELFVIVELLFEDDYKIKKWQSVRTAAWDGDDSIDVWSPED